MSSASPQPTAPLTASRPELLRNGSDEQLRGLIHDLLAFGARLRDIRDAIGALVGLSGPAYTILIAVAHLQRHGEVGVTAVARHLSLSQPFVTAEVGKLVGAGLLDKSPSATDARSVSLTVTPDAQRLLAGLAPDQTDINDALFASLGADDFDRLSVLVHAMVGDADRSLQLASARIAAERIGGAA